MVEIEASIGRLHLLKSAVDREIGDGKESGRNACPNCPHDGSGTWRLAGGFSLATSAA